jgi:hypothetical protein
MPDSKTPVADEAAEATNKKGGWGTPPRRPRNAHVTREATNHAKVEMKLFSFICSFPWFKLKAWIRQLTRKNSLMSLFDFSPDFWRDVSILKTRKPTLQNQHLQ